MAIARRDVTSGAGFEGSLSQGTLTCRQKGEIPQSASRAAAIGDAKRRQSKVPVFSPDSDAGLSSAPLQRSRPFQASWLRHLPYSAGEPRPYRNEERSVSPQRGPHGSQADSKCEPLSWVGTLRGPLAGTVVILDLVRLLYRRLFIETGR